PLSRTSFKGGIVAMEKGRNDEERMTNDGGNVGGSVIQTSP
ncbi:hypothetical protein HMPREF9078_00530, partial [Capnocytophaga sp. oral taxon 380 str. F0488]